MSSFARRALRATAAAAGFAALGIGIAAPALAAPEAAEAPVPETSSTGTSSTEAVEAPAAEAPAAEAPVAEAPAHDTVEAPAAEAPAPSTPRLAQLPEDSQADNLGTLPDPFTFEAPGDAAMQENPDGSVTATDGSNRVTSSSPTNPDALSSNDVAADPN